MAGPPKGNQPPKLNQPAPAWLHKVWDELINWISSFRPFPGPGIDIDDAPGGGKLISNAQPFPPPPTFHAFQVTAQPNNTIKVHRGDVNGEEPTPVGEVTPDIWIWEVTGTRYVYLEAELDGEANVITSYIKVGASVPETPAGNPTTGTPPATAYRSVAKIVVGVGTMEITQYVFAGQTIGAMVYYWSATEQKVRIIFTP